MSDFVLSALQIIQTKIPEKSFIYCGLLNLINTTKGLLIKKNKSIFNFFFQKEFEEEFKKYFPNQKLDLNNFEHFKFAYENVLKKRNQYLYSILLHFVLTPNLFEDYKCDTKSYKIKLLRYIIQKAQKHGIIYGNITYFCKDLCANFTYYYAYSGTSNKILYELVSKLFRLICPSLNYKKKQQQQSKNSKIKIGFFGNNMTFNHSIANNQMGTFKYLAEQENFDVYAVVYENNGELNEYFKNNQDKILTLGKLDPSRDCVDKMVEKASELNFDIIVYTEIGMDFAFKCLAHCRLAKIQMTTWGHSETSGIDTIDYYITSKYFENENSQDENYSEKLIIMNSLSTYYPEKVSELFKMEAQRVILKQFNRNNKLKLPENAKVYGCLQLYHKFDDSFIRTSQKILEQDPNAYILLLDYKEQENDFREFLNKNTLNNKIILVDKCDFYTYCQYLDLCDVIIDNINFGGCNSTLQAFTLGKVVIAFPQKTLCTNFTSGFYKRIGFTEPLCYSEDEYVQKAIYYANLEGDEKETVSNKIKELSSVLFNEKESCDDWMKMMLA